MKLIDYAYFRQQFGHGFGPRFGPEGDQFGPRARPHGPRQGVGPLYPGCRPPLERPARPTSKHLKKEVGGPINKKNVPKAANDVKISNSNTRLSLSDTSDPSVGTADQPMQHPSKQKPDTPDKLDLSEGIQDGCSGLRHHSSVKQNGSSGKPSEHHAKTEDKSFANRGLSGKQICLPGKQTDGCSTKLDCSVEVPPSGTKPKASKPGSYPTKTKNRKQNLTYTSTYELPPRFKGKNETNLQDFLSDKPDGLRQANVEYHHQDRPSAEHDRLHVKEYNKDLPTINDVSRKKKNDFEINVLKPYQRQKIYLVRICMHYF